MVGHVPLEDGILVRVQVPQQILGSQPEADMSLVESPNFGTIHCATIKNLAFMDK
ncbi:MAG: hypothetical protein UR22_C0001G0040 [Parcubacteria group bacterium GW2011_GWC2_32_10]|nr:MAG: hypothetical protein UR22_C0001G0040 [Parcubacteria group bacterium GW2011_GWC2_32_10]